MKNLFRLQDIINLEYLFHQDKGQSPLELHARDRKIALACNPQAADNSPEERLHGWLTCRLHQEFAASQRSPGEIFTDLSRIVTLVTILQGAFLGTLAGLAFFSYTGRTPVNVFQFLLLFIVPQLLLVALLLCSGLVKKLLPALHLPIFYTLFFERAFHAGLQWIQQRWQKDFPADKRDSIAHAFGIVRIQNSRYGALFYWPLFSLVQGFGLAFNLALLTMTLLKITTTDLAFGWQSTIQFTDMAVLRLVRFLALPWEWFLGETSFPGLPEIAGSRIILKEGIYHLGTADLTSWWPFLVMCLFVYGVITRGIFLFLGRWMAARQERAIPLDTPQCRALLQRMARPLVTTQAEAEPRARARQGQNGSSPVPAAPRSKTTSQRKYTNLIPQTVLVGIDIYDQLADPLQTLATELAVIGFSPRDIHPFQLGYDEDHQLLKKLRDRTEHQGIVILLEGWMVPLVSLLSYLREIRATISHNEPITVALTGRPGTRLFTPLQESEFSIWQRKIETLADPYLQLLPMAGTQA